MIIRAIRGPHEIEAITLLDTSFVSTRIFHVARAGQSFSLSEQAALPAVRKSYLLSRLPAEILPSDHTFVAEHDGDLIGIASMRFEPWNKRSMLRHLYISAAHRKQGVGRALLEAVSDCAVAAGARCLWAETQNTNYPAVQFYLRMGFHLCGLDTSLYAISDDPAAEIGLFFTKPVMAQNA